MATLGPKDFQKYSMFASQKKWHELAIRLVAELAIVVLGVSIALWADSWVASRSDRLEEIA